MKYIAILFWPPYTSWIGSRFPVAAAREQGETVATVRAYLDTLEQEGFSGAVLIEFEGKVVVSKGYGYSDVQNRRSNPPALSLTSARSPSNLPQPRS